MLSKSHKKGYSRPPYPTPRIENSHRSWTRAKSEYLPRNGTSHAGVSGLGDFGAELTQNTPPPPQKKTSHKGLCIVDWCVETIAVSPGYRLNHNVMSFCLADQTLRFQQLDGDDDYFWDLSDVIREHIPDFLVFRQPRRWLYTPPRHVVGTKDGKFKS